MVQTINRRQFLRGDFRGNNASIRPPWALDEGDFIEMCTGCGDCISACPESILITSSGGFPSVDFNHGECTFCRSCVDSCQPGALKVTDTPWELLLNISESCLALKSIVCSVCAEQCEVRAIHFTPVIGGVSQPNIDSERCNGCGACVHSCPGASISFLYRHNQKEFIS